MTIRPERLIHKADIVRLVRAFTNGVPATTQTTIVEDLPCLLESTAPKSLALSHGWIERASYVCTWTKDTTIKAGDLLVFNGQRHQIKSVRRDLQGNYWTAILEAEAK